ncbi:hypothetical protein LTS07_005845 [Exophiala sideris]|uniref:C3H1-type domain-containing protein n=1 Tax=Exophiala sideris TaxID=1016849 RepID=A0ABR0J777_9EURO|nr:hypothetical protein LTS07_005845 [Exophiala sideris]KAK5036919.1 hypothetical protein LTR13_005299 [Exophiala sideris]KAK5058013.1 hypothetical protein LTR69_007010 [Exophiala sideris]KAK5181972.1 hypothetical protein LTR44_005573 [Eurotiomycetes sp. CCFEE 6388]
MFGSNTLSLPPPFAHEHHPLRLTAETSRPQPAGGCRYVLSHPSAQNQQCSCQSFHHNRTAPGNICDCGHQACFHVHDVEKQNSEVLSAIIEKLGEKIRHLEETVQSERGNREAALSRERQLWEGDTRILREALAPFYQNEKEMRRKIVELESKLENNHDEQIRLRERVLAVDDVNVAIEKRVEELEGLRSKRRRVGRGHGQDEPPLQNGHVSPNTMPARRVSSSIDERSAHTPSSRALSPNGSGSTTTDPEEPRSSGILNLVEMPRSALLNMPQHLSPSQEEPRSSGFLTVDRAEGLSQTASEQAQTVALHHAARITPPHDRPSPPVHVKLFTDIPRSAPTPPDNAPKKVPLLDVMVLPVNTSPKKRKYHLDHIALDVLADVSMASPLIH